MPNTYDDTAPQTDFYGKEIKVGDRLLCIGYFKEFLVVNVTEVYQDRVITDHPNGAFCGFSLTRTNRNTIIQSKETT